MRITCGDLGLVYLGLCGLYRGALAAESKAHDVFPILLDSGHSCKAASILPRWKQGGKTPFSSQEIIPRVNTSGM